MILRHTPEQAAILNLLNRVVTLESRIDRVDRVAGWEARPAPVDMRGFRSVRKTSPWAFASVRGAK